jgi:hypothetical protein
VKQILKRNSPLVNETRKFPAVFARVQPSQAILPFHTCIPPSHATPVTHFPAVFARVQPSQAILPFHICIPPSHATPVTHFPAVFARGQPSQAILPFHICIPPSHAAPVTHFYILPNATPQHWHRLLWGIMSCSPMRVIRRLAGTRHRHLQS